MFDREEQNPKTRNHRFFEADNARGYSSEPATDEELKAARDAAGKVPGEEWDFRSCWECNSAHTHLMDRSMMCFACGRYYHHGVDITQHKPPSDGQEAQAA